MFNENKKKYLFIILLLSLLSSIAIANSCPLGDTSCEIDDSKIVFLGQIAEQNKKIQQEQATLPNSAKQQNQNNNEPPPTQPPFVIPKPVDNKKLELIKEQAPALSLPQQSEYNKQLTPDNPDNNVTSQPVNQKPITTSIYR